MHLLVSDGLEKHLYIFLMPAVHISAVRILADTWNLPNLVDHRGYLVPFM